MQQAGQIIRFENGLVFFSNFIMIEANLYGSKLFEFKNCFLFLFENIYLKNLSYIGDSTTNYDLSGWQQCRNKGYNKISNLTIQGFTNKNGKLSNFLLF